MIILEMYAPAVLSSDKLRVLSNSMPPPNLPDPIIASHKLSAILNDRTETQLNISLPTFYKLRDLAILTLALDPNIPSLQAVPLLLEAIYLDLLVFPILLQPLQTNTAFELVSPQAFDNLRPLKPETLSQLILNTPIPDRPLVHPSNRRDRHLWINLTTTESEHLTNIGRRLLVRYSSKNYVSIALDWIGVNYETHQ